MVKTSSVSDLATKTDLNKAVKSSERLLRAEILKVEEKVENVDEGMERLEKKLGDKIDGIEVKLDRIANQLDGFVGRVDDLTNDNEIGADQIHRLREDAKHLETRVSKLEAPTH